MSRTASAKKKVAQPAEPTPPYRAVKMHGLWVRLPADALTGVPVDLSDTTTPTLVMREWDDTRNTEAPLVETEYIPTKINVERIDRGDGKRDATPDRLGGKAFSRDMQQFLSGVLPRTVMEEKGARLRWWDVEYVRGRLYARLGKELIDAVLRVERDGESLDEVAKSIKKSRVWLCSAVAQTRRLSAAFFSYGLHHHRVRPSASTSRARPLART